MKYWQITLITALLSSNAACTEGFRLESPQMRNGGRFSEQQILQGYGCNGRNVSPELRWSGAPPGTRSFALTVHDPDAPTGSGWWHWVVFDIPASERGLLAGAGNPQRALAPAGSVQGATDFGTPGYGGPCPPEGTNPHRYRFVLYALKVDKLPVDAKTPAAMVSYLLRQNALGQASMEVFYSR